MHRKPLALVPATVEKPWGREIWHSGIEQRGESRVRIGEADMPLSRFLAEQGRSQPITLLKTLHPTAGNLYIEVHATKSETYAVEHVAADGGMLLGVKQSQRRALGDEGFRATLLAAAQAAEAGTGSLCAVEALFNRVELQPGDTVTIPPRVPHSLRRGSTVVEFQTPTYERKILAASQPVVTQTSWDCAEAVATMDLANVPSVTRVSEQPFAAPSPVPDADFKLVRLAAGAQITVPPWSVAWVFRGDVRGDGCHFSAGTAFLTPTQARLEAGPDAIALVAVETRAVAL